MSLVIGQTQSVDSSENLTLEEQLVQNDKAGNENQEQVETQDDLANERGRRLTSDEVILRFDSLRASSTKLSDSAWIMEYHALINSIFEDRNYERIFDHVDDIKSLLGRSSRPHKEILDIYYLVAGIYQAIGSPIPAIEMLLEGIDFVKAEGLKKHYIGQYYISIAEMRYVMGEYAMSLVALDSAAALIEPDHWKIHGEVYSLYAILSIEYQEDAEEAIRYYRKSKDAYLQAGDTSGYFTALTNEAFTYSQMNKLDSAELITDFIIKQAQARQDSLLEAVSFYYISEYQNARKKYNAALVSLDRASKLYGDNVKFSLLVQITYMYYEAHKGLAQHEEALNYYVTYSELMDSLAGKETLRQVVELEKDVAFEKEQSTLNLIHEKEVAEERLLRNRLAIGLFTLLLLFLVALYFGRQLRRQKSQLEELGKVKDRIFAVIAHDMRKPAIAYRGLSKKIKYLLKNKEFETMESLGENLEQNTDQLFRITDNLINWAVLELGVQSNKKESLSIKVSLEEVTNMFDSEIARKNLKISNVIDPKHMVSINSESTKVIFRNILHNAIKHTPKGGQISLSSQADEKFVKIIIQDKGQGMTLEQLKNLFILSQDKSQADTEGEKSAGIGMYLVKRLIENNNGSIHAESQIGEGSQIMVSLPIAMTSK